MEVCGGILIVFLLIPLFAYIFRETDDERKQRIDTEIYQALESGDPYSLYELAEKLYRECEYGSRYIDFDTALKNKNIHIGANSHHSEKMISFYRGRIFYLYKTAAEQGEYFSQRKLAWAYEHGYGVKEDAWEAIKLYRKAAERGDSDARNALARRGIYK